MTRASLEQPQPSGVEVDDEGPCTGAFIAEGYFLDEATSETNLDVIQPSAPVLDTLHAFGNQVINIVNIPEQPASTTYMLGDREFTTHDPYASYRHLTATLDYYHEVAHTTSPEHRAAIETHIGQQTHTMALELYTDAHQHQRDPQKGRRVEMSLVMTLAAARDASPKSQQSGIDQMLLRLADEVSLDETHNGNKGAYAARLDRNKQSMRRAIFEARETGEDIMNIYYRIAQEMHAAVAENSRLYREANGLDPSASDLYPAYSEYDESNDTVFDKFRQAKTFQEAIGIFYSLDLPPQESLILLERINDQYDDLSHEEREALSDAVETSAERVIESIQVREGHKLPDLSTLYVLVDAVDALIDPETKEHLLAKIDATVRSFEENATIYIPDERTPVGSRITSDLTASLRAFDPRSNASLHAIVTSKEHATLNASNMAIELASASNDT